MEVSESEYGPWINHDGKGCPCVGRVVEVVEVDNRWREIGIKIAVARGGNGWVWTIGNPSMHSKIVGRYAAPIIRYRIRKPRGMSILSAILREVEGDGGKGYDVDRVKEGVG